MSFFGEYLITQLSNSIGGYVIDAGGNSGLLLLSNSVAASGSTGTVIGNFSVSGGSTRAYTFTLTVNPGTLFAVGGSTLSINSSFLNASVYPISARASDTGTSIITGNFNITVASTSPVVPTFELFGF